MNYTLARSDMQVIKVFLKAKGSMGFHKALLNLNKKFRKTVSLLASIESASIVQLIGSCQSISMLTEFHTLGNLSQIHLAIAEKTDLVDDIRFRFLLCINFAKVMSNLHKNKGGAITLCDSRKVTRYLSQFLVTSSLNIVLNDIESLKYFSEKSNASCSSRNTKITAPEEVNGNSETITEKKDIYKIPFVTQYLLGSHEMNPYLDSIHRRCKSKNASERPTAEEVLYEYKKVAKKIGMKNIDDPKSFLSFKNKPRKHLN